MRALRGSRTACAPTAAACALHAHAPCAPARSLTPSPPQGGPSAPAEAKEAVLSEERFKQLDQLLNKTGMYTQFLTEQLAAISEAPGPSGSGAPAAEEEEEEEAGGKKGKGGKRKGGKAPPAKRQKKDNGAAGGSGVTATKVGGCGRSGAGLGLGVAPAPAAGGSAVPRATAQPSPPRSC
jgi:hypothetical protein